MGKLIEDPSLRDRVYVFADRADAGQRLAVHFLKYRQDIHLFATPAGGVPVATKIALFAIPAGGVPVAAEIARLLGIPLDLIIVRKIQLPWTTEAGFGALNPAGEAILNEDLLERLRLTPEEIQEQVQKTAAILQQREARLRGGKPYPRLKGRPTLVVDDGLASGYTMRAALKFLKEQGARPLIVAVPTGSGRTVRELQPLVDELYCLNVRTGPSFAVADAYRAWYDLTEDEVLGILRSVRKD
ncbi:MAG: phosphoribosyltransferase [Deltaproteobacteria bacterium]|nr:phosphoribosyltransferase [Deltaproteobacteria bacterium]